MNYLLDTHILLWFLSEERHSKFSQKSIDILLDERNELYFSVVSIWEMAIKYSLGKPDFDYDPQEILQELLRQGFKQLDMNVQHIFSMMHLPSIHRDPFDRLLIAQAQVEKLQFFTADQAILNYTLTNIINVQE
ncbi:MAG: type II toxin-antitoxin system VapC family toxin [Acinetobacter sp.]|nr:type II toxin-antitoxin system VapC family toxin [Acinetobacter sp.]